MSNATFATAINCIDGRVQCPVKHWMKENLGIEYVDMVTEPGPDEVMAEGSLMLREAIRRKVMISVNAHKSTVVAVVGHHDCAGNPLAKEDHLRQVRKGADTVRTWNVPVRVLGLWVNDKWEVEVVSDTGKV
jgi:carbonic anhydrase